MSGRRRYSAPVLTPQQVGDAEAQKAIAKADALRAETDRRRAAVIQRAQAAPFGKWGTMLDRPDSAAYSRSPDAYGAQGAGVVPETNVEGRRRVATQREQAFTGFFGTQPGQRATNVGAPTGDFGSTGLLTTPSDQGTTTVGQYGGGTQRAFKNNELLQPYFANEKGDQTHTVLPKTPGEDPRLDPVYAANVFRKAGDTKTAAAYEKYASTMDPSKFVGPGGAKWENPHFGVTAPAPATTVGTPGTAIPASKSPPNGVTGPLDVLGPTPTGDFSRVNLGAQQEQTFAGKPLSAISDTSTNAPVFPSREFLAGQAFRQGAGDVFSLTPGSPTSRGAPPPATPIGKPLFDLPAFIAGAGGGEASPAYRFGGAGRAPGTPDAPLLSGPDFFRGASAGRSTASGVSRATAADFQQPTKANPLPTTPTTPDRNIDESKGAIANFALPKLDKDKYAFQGF